MLSKAVNFYKCCCLNSFLNKKKIHATVKVSNVTKVLLKNSEFRLI